MVGPCLAGLLKPCLGLERFGLLCPALLRGLAVVPLEPLSGGPLDAVVAMIVPILIPFNLLKGLLNAILTLIVYKAISNLITPKKDQVKGR